MAAELAKFAIDLRAVRKGQVRNLVAQHVQAIDLLCQDRLNLVVELIQKAADGLIAARIPVVDGVEGGHVRTAQIVGS